MSYEWDIRDLKSKCDSLRWEMRNLETRCENVERDIRSLIMEIDQIKFRQSEMLNTFEGVNETLTVLNEGLTQLTEFLFETVDIKGVIEIIKELQEKTPKTIKEELKQYSFKEFPR